MRRLFSIIHVTSYIFNNRLAGWMHQRFFQFNNTITYYPVTRNDSTMVMYACNELRPLILRDPASLIGRQPSFTASRRLAARTLLVRLAEHPWAPQITQQALRELIDLAHITEHVGLPQSGIDAVLQRFANITLLFNQRPETVSTTALLPHVEMDIWTPRSRSTSSTLKVQE